MFQIYTACANHIRVFRISLKLFVRPHKLLDEGCGDNVGMTERAISFPNGDPIHSNNILVHGEFFSVSRQPKQAFSQENLKAFDLQQFFQDSCYGCSRAKAHRIYQIP